jgi:hypothetical protein
MIAPHYIGESKSDIRGIKPGWYAIEDDGTPRLDLFPAARNASRESPARGPEISDPKRAGSNKKRPTL